MGRLRGRTALVLSCTWREYPSAIGRARDFMENRVVVNRHTNCALLGIKCAALTASLTGGVAIGIQAGIDHFEQGGQFVGSSKAAKHAPMRDPLEAGLRLSRDNN